MKHMRHTQRFENGARLFLALAMLAFIAHRASCQVVVPQVSAGGEFSAALAVDGRVWTWGNNSLGQLGRCGGTMATPQAISGMNDIAAIACGGVHMLALTNTGQVKGWGYNVYGQLGFTGVFNVNCPQLLPTVSGASQIAAGPWHSLVRLSNGTVLAFGQGAFGVLGLGNQNSAFTPTVIPGLANVVDIAAGTRHSAAVLANGTLVTWGDNSAGQLGFNGASTFWPTPVPGISGAVAVACGALATLCLDNTGVVRQWGATGNYSGWLPQVVLLPAPASAIASAQSVSAQMALLTTGAVHTWGDDCTYGTLGGGTAACSSGPTPIQPTGLGATSVSIACGSTHCVALSSSGAVSSWGLNNFGQLGYATAGASPTPATVPGVDLIWYRLALVAVGGSTELHLNNGAPSATYANICTAAAQSGPTGALINFGGLWITFADMIAWSVCIQAGYPMATGALNAAGQATVTLPVLNSTLAGITINAISFSLAAGAITDISPITTHTF